MALQIWLPLNGNLNNQGLNTYTISNTGVIDSLGKIGSCYSYSKQYTLISGNVISNLSKFSISCWVYLTNASTYNIFTSENASGYWQFLLGNNSIKVRDSVSGLTGSRIDKNITAIPSSVWVHVTVVYDEGVVKVYQNGVLKDTLTFHSGATMNTHDKMYIGADGLNDNSTYPGNCKINDFRVYNHCLSDKEVSEISKGLILHYKLSENYQTLNNSFKYPTFNTSSGHGGWSHWAPSNNTGTYSQNTNREYIYRDTQTYSHYFEHKSGANYYICYQSPAFEGGYRSAQAIIKMPNGEDPRGHVLFSHNANVGTNPPTTFTQLGDGFWLMKHEGFQQDGSNDLVSIYITHNKGVYISEAYLENDRKVCSDIFSTKNNNVIDCSGYGINGTLYGSVTSSTDTARYDGSVVFDGGNTAIKIGNLSSLIHDGIFTFNCWFNKQDFSSKGWETIFGGPSGFEFQSKRSTTNSPSLVAYSWGQSNSGGQVYELNKWNMVTMVRTSSDCKFYLNGSLYYTGSAGSIPSGDYFLGSWRDYSSQNYKGMFSDVRIYATALSDNDIKELYSVGSSIDNNGNLMCYMANEGNNGDSRELGPYVEPSSSNVVFNNDGSYTISGYTFLRSEYIHISPTNKKYYYDIEYSNINGNQLYIGFERYDKNKQSGSNSESQYVVATAGGVDHKRIKGTINLSTANGNTAAYTRLRILNDWNNTGNTTYKSTIHHMSLKEVIETNTVDVTQKGVFDCDEFIESSSASINNIGNVTCNQLIEI